MIRKIVALALGFSMLFSEFSYLPYAMSVNTALAEYQESMDELAEYWEEEIYEDLTNDWEEENYEDLTNDWEEEIYEDLTDDGEEEYPDEFPELDVGIRSSVNHLFVGDGVSVTATIREGVAPFTVELRVSVNDETCCVENYYLDADGIAELTYYPETAGDYVASATVLDAAGREKQVRVVTAVAEYVVEYPAVWEKSVEDIDLSGDWREDIVAIAKSQLGYRESIVNFIIEDDVRRGYTRYGDWYGAPYAQWCGMFVAFCQAYAGISAEEYPQAAGVSAYMDALDSMEALEDYDYMPARGDLVFFMWEGEDAPGHMGIVENIADGILYTIEGNSNAMVQRKSYPLDAEEIIGYANTNKLMKLAGMEAAEPIAKPDIEMDGTAVTVMDSVNVRSQPSLKGAYIRKIRHAGTIVTLLGSSGEGDARWYLVKFNDVIGYVRGDLLALDMAADDVASSVEETEKVFEEELFFSVDSRQNQASGDAGEQEEELFFGLDNVMLSPMPNKLNAVLSTPVPETEPEAELDDEPEYICDKAAHEHEQTCYDDANELICNQEAHAHDETCVKSEEIPEDIEETDAEYVCGLEAHAHEDACYDEEGTLICQTAEHTHDETCLVLLAEELEPEVLVLTRDAEGKVSFVVPLNTGYVTTFFEVRVYDGEEAIIDQSLSTTDTSYEVSFVAERLGEYTAEIVIFLWGGDEKVRVLNYVLNVQDAPTYYCGLEEHVHGEGCADPCELVEHTHDLYCEAEKLEIALSVDPESLITKDPTQPVLVAAQVSGGVSPYAVSMVVLAEGEEGREIAAEATTPEDDGDASAAEYAFTFVPGEFGKYVARVFVEDADGRLAQQDLSIEIVRELEEWEESIAGVELTGDPNIDVLAIATTQIGYQAQETDLEFEGEAPATEYETRYGDWYGQQREEWSTLFAAFCLHYANLTEYPTADSAQAWAQILENERYYRDAASYVPMGGDLAFVDLNGDGTIDRMAVVSSVATDENGDATDVVVIIGNHGSSVKTITYPVSGGNIIGYGTYRRTEPEVEYTPETWDVTKGPMFWITAVLKAEVQQRLMLLADVAAQADAVDLKTYLEKNNGEFNFTLTDLDNNDLKKPDGSYEVTAGLLYKLSMTVAAKGIAPGTYTYQLPEGLTVVEGTGPFKLNNGVTVGEWSVTSDGLITFEFYANMKDYQDVTISAAMGTEFSESKEEIIFDGNIHVEIKKPVVEEGSTTMAKWGDQGDPEYGQDPNRIYWTVQVAGNRDSHILGNTITDTIMSGNHQYTQEDINRGLKISAVLHDSNGKVIDYHAWDAYPGDENSDLQWSETGWTYTMPTQCRCHGQELGNDDWVYTFEYTSTPKNPDATGANVYTNKVQVDGTADSGEVTIDFGHSGSGVVKTGTFLGDAEGGKFYWQIMATIPGITEESKTTYYWNFWDQMKIINSNKEVGTLANSINLSTVTATNKGHTYNVPRVEAATENDPFAWSVDLDNEDPSGGVVNFYCKCVCNENNCPWWNGTCASLHYTNKDFCRCWNVEDTTEFTFTYVTADQSILDKFGGVGNEIYNYVYLNLEQKLPDGKWTQVQTDNAIATLPIPGIFKKELGDVTENAIATYTITVNEAKLALTNEGSDLLIHDVMTPTLAYIAGSLVITTEDKDGVKTTLTEGVDYTVQYDGSGNQTDKNGPVHVLDITILHPAEVMYTLTYDTMIIISEDTIVGGNVPYSNYAYVELFRNQFNSGVSGKVFTEINIAAQNYRVRIEKHESGTDTKLAGVTFGLYNETGGQVAIGTTDANGELIFKTDIVQGIVLMEHQPYYIQEIEAPTGYKSDDTKHWFYFCANENECTKDVFNMRRIPGKIDEDDEDWLEKITIPIGNKPVELSLTKRVSGGANGDVFLFALELTGDKLSETYTAATFDAAGNVIAESVNPTKIGEPDYSVTIKLERDERYVVYGLPEGTEWKVSEEPSEETSEKYAPSISVDGAAPVNGNSATGEMGKEDIQITITNTRLYDLPSTGGTGTLLYTMGGWLLMAASIFLLYNQRIRRKEEEET